LDFWFENKPSGTLVWMYLCLIGKSIFRILCFKGMGENICSQYATFAASLWRCVAMPTSKMPKKPTKMPEKCRKCRKNAENAKKIPKCRKN
jgi:hypothetical protein